MPDSGSSIISEAGLSGSVSVDISADDASGVTAGVAPATGVGGAALFTLGGVQIPLGFSLWLGAGGVDDRGGVSLTGSPLPRRSRNVNPPDTLSTTFCESKSLSDSNPVAFSVQSACVT